MAEQHILAVTYGSQRVVSTRHEPDGERPQDRPHERCL